MSRRKALRELVRFWVVLAVSGAIIAGPFAVLSAFVNPDWLGATLGCLWVVGVISVLEYLRMRG